MGELSASLSPLVMQSPPGPTVVINGRPYLYFAGTGYLGLQSDGEVVQAVEKAVHQYGIHTATSRSVCGSSPPVLDVERLAAQYLGSEDALYLASGYASNLAVAAAIADQVEIAVLDECAHDSLWDAARMLPRLQVSPLPFRHRDAAHAKEVLDKHVYSGWRPILMTDGLFAVRGDFAPLEEYFEILGGFDRSLLLVDDAHALGAIGPSGRGSFDRIGVSPIRINRGLNEFTQRFPRLLQTASLGKAVGGHGGVIAGSRAFIDHIRQSTGWYRAAGAPATPVAAATATALRMCFESDLRQQLAYNVARTRERLREIGLSIERSESPVIGIALESADRMQAVQQHLEREGIWIAYTRNYAGAGPNGMLRIAVFATHTLEMIERLMVVLQAAIAA